MRRVVVTGMGIVSSIGNNTSEVLESLRTATPGIVFAQEYADLNFRCQVHGAPKLDPFGRLDPALATPQELQGEEIFFNKGRCATCHVGRADREVVHKLIAAGHPALRFELCVSVSGVDYLGTPDRLHSVVHLTSMTFRRKIRLESSVPVDDPHIQSITSVYPTADWQEREAWDMFGIIYDGHPALTRILMPDDWDGHPQRKDYPLGGIPVEYKGAEIPPPDERRAYS